MLPFLTTGIPGTGGVLKESPEDFIVNEIPAYEPSGTGDHLYLTLEKRGMTTLEAVRRISGRLKIPERDIGYAGMKDAAGITRQVVSLSWPAGKVFTAPEFDALSLTPLGRHTNKIKLGHLRGNRFNLVLRGVSGAAGDLVPRVLDILIHRGVPNYFGFQRYGAQGNNHQVGMAMLRQDWRGAVDELIGTGELVRDDEWLAAIELYRRGEIGEALRRLPRHLRTERDVLQRLISRPGAWEQAFAAVNPRLRTLFLSACQSHLFDRVVAARLPDVDRLRSGDLAWIHRNGACFLVEEASSTQLRADIFEISPSGPLFGRRMTEPAGTVRESERDVLSASGIAPESWQGAVRVDGARRPLRVPLEGVSYTINSDTLQLEFSLPKGSYATSVVREITKGW